MNDAESAANLRRGVYVVLTVVTVAGTAARVTNAQFAFEPTLYGPRDAANPKAPAREWPMARPQPMPTFSSNDRSRWATVRALVDEGTFAIGRREPNPAGGYTDTGIHMEDGWRTLDKVLNPATNVFYSSKPPLLSVLVAGEYWLLKKTLGWTLTGERRWQVVVAVLLTFNVVPLAGYLLLFGRVLERHGRTDWGRVVAFAAACFATFVTTFATTLNNHTVAAVAAFAAAYPILMGDGRPSLGAGAVSGLCAGLAFCFELPAASLVVGLFGVLLLRVPGRALLAFVPAAALPVAAQAAVNTAQIGDWKPAYEKVDSEWYRYPGSHWAKEGAARTGIDFAGDKETRAAYAFHLLAGHHGVFSLTPLWLLSVAGMLRVLATTDGRGRGWREVNVVAIGCTAACIVFFAGVVGTVNYGGWTSGPRWFFWLTPFLLIAAIPVLDTFAASRAGRAAVCVLLAASVFSAWYPGTNPWRHPWIYRAMESAGWQGY